MGVSLLGLFFLLLRNEKMDFVEIKTNSNHLVGPIGPKIAKNKRMPKFHFDLVPI